MWLYFMVTTYSSSAPWGCGRYCKYLSCVTDKCADMWITVNTHACICSGLKSVYIGLHIQLWEEEDFWYVCYVEHQLHIICTSGPWHQMTFRSVCLHCHHHVWHKKNTAPFSPLFCAVCFTLAHIVEAGVASSTSAPLLFHFSFW